MDTFFGPYFHFCLELALEAYEPQLLWHILWRVHNLNHTTHWQALNGSGLSNRRTLLFTDQNLLIVPEMVPLQGERSGFYTHLC